MVQATGLLSTFSVVPKSGVLRRRPLGTAHSFAGSVQAIALSALHPTIMPRSRGRGRVQIQANELNKWAGRAMDDDAGYDENPFDRETASVLLRVLTARSVKKLLGQLQELDLHQAQWFNNYCAEHPPTEGNAFLTELFQAKATVLVDNTTQTSHSIDPQNLAHRLLQIRDDMARRATSGLPQFVELENTAVLRSHLERSTFVSGSHQESYKERRGYFGPRRGA